MGPPSCPTSPSSATGGWSATWPPETPTTSSSLSSRSPSTSQAPGSTSPPPPRSARRSRTPSSASTGSPAHSQPSSCPRSSTRSTVDVQLKKLTYKEPNIGISKTPQNNVVESLVEKRRSPPYYQRYTSASQQISCHIYHHNMYKSSSYRSPFLLYSL